MPAVEGIPPLSGPVRQEIEIRVPPWYADHVFAGKVVLPAVETMTILAARVAASWPTVALGHMRQGRFEKFLEIPPASPTVRAEFELTPRQNGEIGATLFSRTRLASLTRIKVHGEIVFGAAFGPSTGEGGAMKPLSVPVFEVPAARIYRELVPFGPAYRNIVDSLQLNGEGGWARVRAPEPSPGRQDPAPLGSPFPLDAAFHIACVWGQRYHKIIAFPIGLESRTIRKATRPGAYYVARVTPTAVSAEFLVFDLEICEVDGSPCEVVRGLRMRDVGGGRLRPPAWISAGK